MPAKKKPAYTLRKATGQARVRIDGKDHYLGPYGSEESRDRYDELITTWLHRREFSAVLLTIDELVLLYLDFAGEYYFKGEKQTSEVHDIRAALRPLISICGRVRVREFGPLKLKAVREAMVAKGWARGTVNAQVRRIRRMFRWGVENEHVPAQILTGLAAVAGLRQGKTAAKDRPRVKPVDERTVDATLPHLPVVVRDMVRLQLLTGMRPAEVCQLRPLAGIAATMISLSRGTCRTGPSIRHSMETARSQHNLVRLMTMRPAWRSKVTARLSWPAILAT